MEFKEPIRAKRIRARDRMLNKARHIAARHFDRPSDMHRDPTTGILENKSRWTDIKGQSRVGILTWEDVFEVRNVWAHNCMNNLAICSCYMCGNPRRWFRIGTRQEAVADIGLKSSSGMQAWSSAHAPRQSDR